MLVSRGFDQKGFVALCLAMAQCEAQQEKAASSSQEKAASEGVKFPRLGHGLRVILSITQMM